MTQVIAPFASKALRQARVLDDPVKPGRKPVRDFTRDEKRIARHLAWDGASAEDIQKAIGFDCCTAIFARKLRALNIHPKRKLGRAHQGDNTTTPACSIKSYRPRRLVTP